jgi:4-hydroxybenzoate polyprenyltransferase
MIKPVLKFVRLPILTTCFALALLGGAVGGSVTLRTLLIAILLIVWYIHAASTNDYSDREIDAINLKNAHDRPLISGELSDRQLWAVHAASAVLAVGLSFIFGPSAVLLTSGMLIIDYIYSLKPIRISDRGAISQLLLATAYVYYPFTLGFWSSGTHAPYPWLLTLSLYLAFVARLFLKDFRDVEGDKRHGKMTFLLRHGTLATCVAASVVGFASLTIMLYVTAFSFGLMLVLVVSHLLALQALLKLAHESTVAAQVNQVRVIAQTANVSVVSVLTYYLCVHQPQLSNLETNSIPLIIGLGLLLKDLHVGPSREGKPILRFNKV